MGLEEDTPMASTSSKRVGPPRTCPGAPTQHYESEKKSDMDLGGHSEDYIIVDVPPVRVQEQPPWIPICTVFGGVFLPADIAPLRALLSWATATPARVQFLPLQQQSLRPRPPSGEPPVARVEIMGGMDTYGGAPARRGRVLFTLYPTFVCVVRYRRYFRHWIVLIGTLRSL
eukprot:939119_1